MQVRELLEAKFPHEIVDQLIKTYREIEKNYQLTNWKISELDAGHFIETVRRLLEHELFSKYTPFSKGLPPFSEAVLRQFEQVSSVNESYRIIIPRILYSVYCIRNKRGVGHISLITPNRMDAVYILHAVKWILAELIRLASAIAPEAAEDIVKRITERELDVVWDDGESFMILSNSITTEEKILITLYKRDNIYDNELQRLVSYSHSTRFKAILRKLTKSLLIDYLPDRRCKISPLGISKVESFLGTPSSL